MKMARDPLVFVVAGESSGDVLASRLIAALKSKSNGHLRLAGVGGPAMAAEGLQTLFPMQELSLMGLIEIVPHIPRLLRRLDETARAVGRLKPDIVITVDSPGFSFRLAKRIRHLNVPIIHYVAPQVWAWRPKRARKIERLLDHIMAILPFEPDFFSPYGVNCTYVGHPAVEQGYGRGNGPAFRRRHSISVDATVLAVLPGSRQSEIDRLLPVFRNALALIGKDTKDLIAVIPTTDGAKEEIARAVNAWPLRSVLVTDPADQPHAYAACEAAITKSGTSTLHLALARVPMVVCYKLNLLTAFLAWYVIKVRHVALANLLTRNPVVPELLQGRCTASNIAHEIRNLLRDPERRSRQLASLNDVAAMLRVGGESPSERAADVVWDYLVLRETAFDNTRNPGSP